MKTAIYWFARNHVTANFLMLIVLIVGAATWMKLRKEIFPETAVDAIAISVPYPNAAPQEVEKGICIPIEEAIQGTDGVERIKSTAAQNVGAVTVEVASGYDVRAVMGDVKTRVDAITNLAEAAEEPTIEEVILKGQVLTIAVSADTDERTLRRLTERVRDELLLYDYSPPLSRFPPLALFQKIMGRAGPFRISTAEIGGARPYEIGIEVPEDTLRELGLNLGAVADAVRRSSIDLPGGTIRTEGGEILIRTEARKYSAPEFGGITVLTRPDGSKVLLRDIATTVDGFEETELHSRFDGRPAMLVKVFRTGDEDTLTLAAAAKEFMAGRARDIFPEGVELEVWADESIYLQGRLRLLSKNLLVGLFLVLLVLALFLRPSLALLVTIGIPVSFAGAVMVMPLTGISINMISLFAFILVLGIVVDDAIVVAENVYRRLRKGEDPKVAAPAGTHEVGVVVVFGILTTVVAFTPMLGLSGISGKIWPNIPWIVIPVLLFSLVQSKLILPSHLAALRPSDPRRQPGRLIRFQQVFSHGLERFVDTTYRPILRAALHNRYLVLSGFLALFVSVIGLVSSGWIKFMFFPAVEADIVSAKLEMPAGVAFAQTSAAVDQIEAAAGRLSAGYEVRDGSSPVVKHMLASSGSQPFQTGFDAIGGPPIATHIGEVTLELYPAAARDITADEIASIWREMTGPIPGAASLTFASQGAGGGNAIDLEIAGDDFAQLEEATAQVKAALAGFAGVIDIASNNRAGKRQLQLAITPEGEAAGLRLGDLANQVRQGFYGEEAQRLQRGRDEVKVLVRYPRAEREVYARLKTMKIRKPDGSEIPFSSVGRASPGRSYATVQRADRRRAITITADIDKATGTNANEVVGALTRETFPAIEEAFPGITFNFQGEQKDQRQSVQEIGRGFILALLIMYILMAIPLRSYAQPIIIMSVIPFGIVGAVIGHIIMRTDLSIMSMCGIVALAGVVVNDSLVLVDYVNRHRAESRDIASAVWEAGAQRFRPILLTSLTTFAGLTPMLLETDIQARFLVPMAISLGFGILFATTITLILVPCVYLFFEDIKSLILRLFGLSKGRPAGPAAP